MMRKQNVTQIYGYPGGAILPVFDAIHNSPHFHLCIPRHEQGAGHMAEGYARASGKPGVLLVTSGPGATNIVTPLMDALMDGVPLVAFSGQVPTAVMGTDAFQEADVLGITRPCTKWNALCRDIADLPMLIDMAFRIAMSGRPGPVLVDLPKDISAATLKRLPTLSRPPPNNTFLSLKERELAMSTDDWARVATMINNAKRPVIMAGHGVVTGGATAELRELATRGNIPVTTTLHGMGGFDEMNPLSLHMLGMHGSAYANWAMQMADVIVCLGARFDDRVTGNLKKFARSARLAEQQGTGGIIHFEILRKNINKTVAATEIVYGDVRSNLQHILPLINQQQRAEWNRLISRWKAQHPFTYTPTFDGTLKPQFVLQELNRLTRDLEVTYTTGVGQHQMWAAQYIRWRRPRSMITSGGLGTMGFGLPAAIGAKMALPPHHIVIDIDGDASFSMTLSELLTAVEFKVAVKVLILNNNFQGMVKQWQELFYEQRYCGTRMMNPDFAKLAEVMGAKGMTLTRREDTERVLSEFLAYNDGPVLLNCIVEKQENVYPMVPAGAALDEMVLSDPSNPSDQL
eukprot:TRINITY_DN9169_c0_g1_i1.p1 TRINITY_DN9169_c0_g1~~TRINITY_DN9169_c0_g1_i1.p1  ORF type:complete len:632 (-),score=127.71 TRINITY_DN9169_c0_g1_i1:92-1810(-)